MLQPLSALLRVPVRRHQLPGVQLSLEELAVRRLVAGVITNGSPMSQVRAGSASSWDTGPTSVTNATNQPLSALRSLAFCVRSFLPLVFTSLQKLMVSPSTVF